MHVKAGTGSGPCTLQNREPPLGQKVAVRPPANPPTLAVVPAVPAGPATVQALGQQLREVLPPRRLQSVSVCDQEANVLWLSEGALGPDENALIIEALEVLGADSSMSCHETGLDDGRYALFLPVRAPTGSLVGLAMILADSRSAGDDTLERVTAPPVRSIMQRLAVLMKPEGAPTGSAERAVPVIEFDLDDDPEVAPASPRPSCTSSPRSAST